MSSRVFDCADKKLIKIWAPVGLSAGKNVFEISSKTVEFLLTCVLFDSKEK